MPTAAIVPQINDGTQLTNETQMTFRKQADSFRLRREVEAINYIRSHTSIPIPSILDMHLSSGDNEQGWVLMERISGCQLDEAWPIMTEVTRAKTIYELRSYLRQLYHLRPPGSGWIGSCSGGPAYDHRLNNMSTCGPFASVAEFHDFLVEPVKNCPRPEWVAKYRHKLSDSHSITFAHADLSWENIMIDPVTGTVIGIVDWEMAGFWPEWWEYRKALFSSRSRQWWIDIVKQIVQEYKLETETDRDLEMF